MDRSCLVATLVLLCSLLTACGGGGGGEGSGGDGGTGSGGGQPVIPDSNAYLPTDTTIRLTYAGNPVPAQFEPATSRNSQLVAPFRYSTGGKEYYVSTTGFVSFMGFYSPHVTVSGAGAFTADVRFATGITLFQADSDAQKTVPVSGTGTVTISPTYGDQPLTYKGTVSYLGTEVVSNSFGSFPSKHVRLSITVSTTIQNTEFAVPFFVDLWFARNLGIVQRLEAGQFLTLVQATGPDGDGDGVFNGVDLFPADPTETRDFDGDGTGDNADADDDDDSVPDASDSFPHNPQESVDFDNDGIGDNADFDDDNDGLSDLIDPFPRNIHNEDTDHDGTPDFEDADDDNDGVVDAIDLFPRNPLESADADNDGVGDNRDIDDDNDGVADVIDSYPTDPTRWELLNVDRATLAFAGVLGSASLPAGLLNVSGDNIAWTVQSSALWLQPGLLHGTGDTLVIVNTNTDGLPVGTHTAKLTFTDTDKQRSVEVHVQLTVTLPVLTVTVPSVSFDGKFGWADLMRPIDVSLNTGNNAYPVNVTVSFDVPGAITTTFSDGVADSALHRLNVTLDPLKLKGGRHVGHVTLTANVKGQEITRTIVLEALASKRILYASSDAVALAQIGIRPSLTRTITVLDSYALPGTPWTATANGGQPWLHIVTPSGLTGDELQIAADPTGLAEGLYEETIALSSSDANVESTKPIRISLWVQDAHRNLGQSLAAAYTQLVADPLRPYMYAHNGSSKIDVYNVHTRAPLASITSLSGTLGPMVTSSDGTWLFVLNPTDGSVTRINLDDTSIRTTWPLTDLKPAGQPSTLAFARPNGHPVLFLSDRRVVDAETGAVFPVGPLGLMWSFDVARATLSADRVCVVTTQMTPFSGGCFAMAFGDYGIPDTQLGSSVAISGFEMPSGTSGFASDVAATADGVSVIVAQNISSLALARFSLVTSGYLGPVLAAPLSNNTSRATRSVATAWDGAIYADVLDVDGIEHLYIWNADGSLRTDLPFNDASVTGIRRQLVVTGDAMGAAYLSGSTPSSAGTGLNFLAGY